MNEDKLVELKDGYIYNIELKENKLQPCETCDYGTKYIESIKFDGYLTDQNKVDYAECTFISKEYKKVSIAKLTQLLIENKDKLKKLTFEEFRQMMLGIGFAQRDGNSDVYVKVLE